MSVGTRPVSRLIRGHSSLVPSEAVPEPIHSQLIAAQQALEHFRLEGYQARTTTGNTGAPDPIYYRYITLVAAQVSPVV